MAHAVLVSTWSVVLGPGPWRGFLASSPASGPPLELKSDSNREAVGNYGAHSRSLQSSPPALSAVCLLCRAYLSWISSEGIGRGFPKQPTEYSGSSPGAWNKTCSYCAWGQLAALPRGHISMERKSVASLTASPLPRGAEGSPLRHVYCQSARWLGVEVSGPSTRQWGA